MHSVHAYGDEALLVTDVANPSGLLRAIAATDLPYRDLAAGADSVMVVLREPSDAAQVWAALSRLPDAHEVNDVVRHIEIPVTYDGMDLAEVAKFTGLSQARIVELHASAEFTVAFCGFAPGFAYLTGLPAELHVPRLATPRTSVPAGSVAIAAEFAGVYPRTSPGGWRILGTTDVTLFDETQTPPALLTPGDRVRFIPR